MAAVLADTHAIVWYLFEPHRLSAPALASCQHEQRGLLGKVAAPTCGGGVQR
jgi:hypothetical protein